MPATKSTANILPLFKRVLPGNWKRLRASQMSRRSANWKPSRLRLRPSRHRLTRKWKHCAVNLKMKPLRHPITPRACAMNCWSFAPLHSLAKSAIANSSSVGDRSSAPIWAPRPSSTFSNALISTNFPRNYGMKSALPRASRSVRSPRLA